MTALGPIAVARVSVTCVVCGLGRHPADARLGLDGLLTPQATRLVCLAGGRRSFASAEMLRTELCGWRVRDGRMRPACHAEAERIAAWRADPVRPTLPPSPHPLEFQVDATKVNTFTGGRDVTIGAFAPRWGAWAERLGLKSFDRLSVLGDGAEWKAADDQFPGHRGTLDFFPAGEHLAATAADGLFGAADAQRRTWSDAARGALLRDGWYGLQEHLGQTRSEPVSEAGRAAVDELVGYLANHANRLNCRHRLATGSRSAAD